MTPDVLDKLREYDEWFNERLPLVQLIHRKFYPDNNKGAVVIHKHYGGERYPWVGTKEPLLQLRGLLSQREEYRTIFGSTGPQLSASVLHPWVWDAAKHLWTDRHYRNAVANAATQVELMLRAKVDRSDMSGSKLVGEAFSLSEPKPGKARLRLPGLEPSSDRFKSAHIGAMHLGQGCFEAIRNWAVHTLDNGDQHSALEFLAALSIFARWIDQASVVDARQ